MVRSALAAAFVSLAAGPALAQDGAQLFATQCGVCHKPRSSALAPSLAGIAGARIAARADFTYSPALKAKGGTWTDARLDAFLKSPAAFAPGVRMPMALAAEDARSAVIAYLHRLK